MTITALVAGSPVGIGSTNRAAITAIQSALGISVSGTYDSETAKAVADFQKKHNLGSVGLTSFGIVGQLTARTLDALSLNPKGKVEAETRSDFTIAPIWFQWALHEVGIKEVPENRGPDVRRYIGLARAGHEGDPWCAIFANAALEANGIMGTQSASSQSFRSSPHFIHLNGPALGAIVVFWRGSRSSGLGHVGFYRGETGSQVYTLGGNEGDRVQIEPLPKAYGSFGLLGYWWPKSVPIPTIGAIPIRSGQPLATVKVT